MKKVIKTPRLDKIVQESKEKRKKTLKQKETIKAIIKGNLSYRRRYMRKSLKTQLKEAKRNDESFQLHWTFRQIANRFEYGGMKEIFKYRAEVKKCGGKRTKMELIDNIIAQFITENKKEKKAI